MHAGKARVWNASGREPPNIRALGSGSDPVWLGDRSLPATQRGITILGVPLGDPEFVAAQLHQLRAKQDNLLQAIRTIPDLQCAWLLLLFCAAPRCGHVLRMLPPCLTAAFGASHNEAVLSSLSDLLGAAPLPGTAARLAQLPFHEGGLGLRSAVSLAPSAF